MLALKTQNSFLTECLQGNVWRHATTESRHHNSTYQAFFWLKNRFYAAITCTVQCLPVSSVLLLHVPSCLAALRAILSIHDHWIDDFSERASMPVIATSHSMLYYDFLGQEITPIPPNETVLLLHGFAGTAETDFAAQLPSLTRQYTVLAPHLHGYGRSSHRQSYSTQYYREDVADMIALLDALALSHVYVLAFSDGAIVGLLLAALHPQRVRALAALGGQATINEQDVAGIRYWLLERPLAEAWQAELAQLHGVDYWRSLPEMYVTVQQQLVLEGGVLLSDEELAAIRCPTLIMHGSRDRIVPVAYARTLHQKISGSRLLLFDAGHAAHLKCEKEYTETVMAFFQEISKLSLSSQGMQNSVTVCKE